MGRWDETGQQSASVRGHAYLATGGLRPPRTAQSRELPVDALIDWYAENGRQDLP